MTDKELRKLSRTELVEIIYELQKQNESGAEEIKQLRMQLEDRTVAAESAGSIAEAALKLNGVFEAAQKAADQYVASVCASYGEIEQRTVEANRECEQIISRAHEEAERIIGDANRQAEKKWVQFNEKVESLLSARAELREMLKKD